MLTGLRARPRDGGAIEISMALFEYSGLNEAGKTVKGMREADTQKALRASLKRDGVFITEVSQASGRKGAATGDAAEPKPSFFSGRISTDDVAITTRQLATLVGAGIPLVESLGALVDQVEHPRLRRIISQVKQRVNEGSSLGDAMNTHLDVFGELYINMIRAGESSGALEVVLIRLADFTESQAKLRNKIVGALAYPAIMVLVGVIIVGILFTTVIPKVTQIFESMNVVLPIYTRVLIGVANFTKNYWYLVIAGVIALVTGLRAYVRTPVGKERWHILQLKVPLFGPLLRLIAMSRFSRTLSTLLASGVPLLVSMDIVRAIVGNMVLQAVVKKSTDAIREGESIAAPLKRSGEFPPMVCHMIAVGERTGQLEDMLKKVADTYDNQVENRVAALTSLLEPIMIVLMGGTVAFIVASIMMPILQMNTLARG